MDERVCWPRLLEEMRKQDRSYLAVRLEPPLPTIKEEKKEEE